MKIHYEETEDVRRYLDNHRDIRLEEKEPHFQNILRAVRRFKPVDSTSRRWEVGKGMGWFTLVCLKNGVQCKGLELSPRTAVMVDGYGEWVRFRTRSASLAELATFAHMNGVPVREVPFTRKRAYSAVPPNFDPI